MDYKGEIPALAVEGVVDSLTVGVYPDEYKFPTVDGNGGDILVSDGAGTMSFMSKEFVYDQVLNAGSDVTFGDVAVGDLLLGTALNVDQMIEWKENNLQAWSLVHRAAGAGELDLHDKYGNLNVKFGQGAGQNVEGDTTFYTKLIANDTVNLNGQVLMNTQPGVDQELRWSLDNAQAWRYIHAVASGSLSLYDKDTNLVYRITQPPTVGSYPTFNFYTNAKFEAEMDINRDLYFGNSINTRNWALRSYAFGDLDLQFREKVLGNSVIRLTQDGAGSGNLVVGSTGVDYTLPKTRGTAKQVLKDVGGTGTLSWEASSTLQEAYEAGLLITIDAAKGPVILRNQTTPNGTAVLRIQDNTNATTMEITGDGSINTAADITSQGVIDAAGQLWASNGNVLVGTGTGNSYYLPPDRIGITDGEVMRLNAATDQLEFYRPPELGCYAQVVNGQNENGTTAEIEISSTTGLGAMTVPANTFEVGSTYHLKIGGLMRNGSSTGDLTVRIYLNAVLISTSGLMNLPALGGTPIQWDMEVDYTVRELGSPGALAYNGKFTYSDNGIKGIGFSGPVATPDTTVDNRWNVSAQWASAEANNDIYVHIFYVHKII